MEKTFKYATIKITLDRKVENLEFYYNSKVKRKVKTYKDIRYCAEILYPAERRMMFCESTLKKLFNSIKREMYV